MGCTDNTDHSEEVVARLKADGKNYYDELMSIKNMTIFWAKSRKETMY